MDISELIQDFVETCGTLTYLQWTFVIDIVTELTNTPSEQGTIARLWIAVILTLCGRYIKDYLELEQFTPAQLELLAELDEILASAE